MASRRGAEAGGYRPAASLGYTSRPGEIGFTSRQAKRSAKAIAREVKSHR